MDSIFRKQARGTSPTQRFRRGPSASALESGFDYCQPVVDPDQLAGHVIAQGAVRLSKMCK